ncbi:MAG: ComEC/Rec2 family competence protein [Nocardioides sp.]
MPLLGLAAWAGGLLAHHAHPVVLLVLAALGACLLALAGRFWRRTTALTLAGLLLAASAVAGATLLRQQAVAVSPVASLAGERAVVTLTATVTSDPRPVQGRFADQVLVRVEARSVTGRGLTHELATPVLVIGGDDWTGLMLGSTIRTSGRLVPSDGDDLAGVLTAARDPVVLSAPDAWWRAATRVRASIREAVAHRPDDQRALVPALVDGDDAALDPGLADDFRATGLTHLTAVSGTNLTLVVGFLLILARWCRVPGRWLYVVGALGIAGFVLLARTEPSVLRAAVMGTVGLLAMGINGRDRAFRALGVAVLVLLLVQPGLAVSVGFTLSVIATTGIIVLAPGWRDALAAWLPRWLAEAVSVPAAAQLACTPVVAAVSGQVSLVAVGANLLVAPAVGPVTVLGLAGGIVGLVVEPLGRGLGSLAGWCAAWIIAVARRGADLPTAAVDWGTGAASLALLTVLCGALALWSPLLLRRPVGGIGCSVLLVAAVTVPMPSPGWPAPGWVLAMCDVGQGDALVLRAGPGSGIVVDAGPDPGTVDRCLTRLGIGRVPLVLLTHFHADHVDGLSGVLDGREVGSVETTRVLDPPDGVRDVSGRAEASGVALTYADLARTRVVGDVTLQVVWPVPGAPEVGPGDGSAANDASLVVLADVGGIRILLTGDVEPPGQAALARDLVGLDVDVLKVPHHGSRYQDTDWLRSLRPTAALVSVGADNDYGHPSTDLLDTLTDGGVEVARTDEDGDVLVVAAGDGSLALVRSDD